MVGWLNTSKGTSYTEDDIVVQEIRDGCVYFSYIDADHAMPSEWYHISRDAETGALTAPVPSGVYRHRGERYNPEVVVGESPLEEEPEEEAEEETTEEDDEE